jgi:SAM-dependent methyltransferase
MSLRTDRKINLACGSVFVSGDGWENLDYSVRGGAVQKADLLGRLPLSDHCAALVYSSHFLEHIPRDLVSGFLEECYRVLEPGGVIRLVLPDLEELCKSYLHYRELGEHKKADFVVIQIVDQCVRRNSGGELGRIYRELRSSCSSDSQFIQFIRERNGENLLGSESQGGKVSSGGGGHCPPRTASTKPKGGHARVPNPCTSRHESQASHSSDCWSLVWGSA